MNFLSLSFINKTKKKRFSYDLTISKLFNKQKNFYSIYKIIKKL